MKYKRLPLAVVLVLVVSLAACKDKSDPEGDILEVKEYSTVMKTGKVLIDPVHGKEVAFWYGAIGSEKSNGVGYIHTFEDGASIVTANLNILLAEKGTHYQAFLVSDDGKKEVDIGQLNSIIGDARHSIRFETQNDISGMTKLEVRHMKGLLGGSEVVGSGTLKKPAEPVEM